MHIYCQWVAGSFKEKVIGKELLDYAIEDAKTKKMRMLVKTLIFFFVS